MPFSSNSGRTGHNCKFIHNELLDLDPGDELVEEVGVEAVAEHVHRLVPFQLDALQHHAVRGHHLQDGHQVVGGAVGEARVNHLEDPQYHRGEFLVLHTPHCRQTPQAQHPHPPHLFHLLLPSLAHLLHHHHIPVVVRLVHGLLLLHPVVHTIGVMLVLLGLGMVQEGVRPSTVEETILGNNLNFFSQINTVNLSKYSLV